jgi:SAM-dependent methyltransferase
VVLGDAMDMPLADACVAHALSVWVLQSVADPVRVCAEVARVLQPAGRYAVATTQRPSSDDVIGQVIERMGAAVDARRDVPRRVTADQVLGWASSAGLTGDVQHFDRVFHSTPLQELDAVVRRAWPALRELDEKEIEAVTRPAIEQLRALPDVEHARRVTVELVILRRHGET